MEDPAHDARLWEDVTEVARAVMTSGAPSGFVRRKLPVGGWRANAYAKVAPGEQGRPATVLVVITATEDAPASPAALRRRFGLTRRESEVAVLLAERRSNREISEALGIAERTARRHTEQVLLKLNKHSRTEVAAVVEGLQRETAA